jgi:hypothetical protein
MSEPTNPTFDLREAGAARAEAAAFAADHGIVGDDLWGLLLIVTELVANAIKYGGGYSGLRLAMDGEHVLVRILQPEVPQPADVDPESGRGLRLVRAFAPGLHFMAVAPLPAHASAETSHDPHKPPEGSGGSPGSCPNTSDQN